MNRRKLKGERELVADINKRFKIFCDSFNGCAECIYRDVEIDCRVVYVQDLLKKYSKGDEE